MKKRCKVVMLPTKETAKKGNLVLQNMLLIAWMSSKNPVAQHLYILSDDEIKNGDYCYDKILNIVFQVNDGDNYEYLNTRQSGIKKIISTTNTSLKIGILKHTENCKFSDEKEFIKKSLPKPSKEFIEKYIELHNSDKITKEVLVEYWGGNERVSVVRHPDLIQPKINHNNTINIEFIKDNWTREEVIKLINDFHDYSFGGIKDTTKDNWIEENL